MAKLERRMQADVATLANYLNGGIIDSGMSVELVESSVQRIGEVSVWLYVYDKYYMRNSSRTALTVQIVGNGEQAYVTAIGAGGGNGSIFRFSYGAESNFVSVVSDLLDEYGKTR